MLGAAWVAFERRQAEPLVDIAMMRERAITTTNLTAFLVGFGMFGSFILIPQLVQTPEASGFGFGATVTQAGVFMAPSALMMLFAGPLAGWLGSRYGSRLPLLIGTAVGSASFVLLLLTYDSRLGIYFASAALGLGIGFAFASMANLVVEAVHPSRTGVATGMNTIMRTIGGSLGGQIAASIVAAHVALATGLPQAAGFELAFVVSAVGMAGAFVAALAIPQAAGLLAREARPGDRRQRGRAGARRRVARPAQSSAVSRSVGTTVSARTEPSRTSLAVASRPIRSATMSRCRSVADSVAAPSSSKITSPTRRPGALRRAAVDHLDHLDSPLGAGFGAGPRRQRAGPAGDPEVGPPHPAVGDQGRDDPLGRRAHRHGQPEPDACDGGVDADHVPAAVRQRAAGVARVQRGIGLDDVVDHAHSAAGAGRQRAAKRRDDARR